MKTKIQITALITVTVLLAAFAINGCNGSSDIIDPPEDNTYDINGVLVKDLNITVISDSSRVAVKLRKNGNSINDAELSFLNEDLTYALIDNSTNLAYVFPASYTALAPVGNYQFGVVDGALLDDNFAVTLLDTIRITSYNPDSTTVNLNGEVTNIQWTSALNVEGYVVAVTPADSAYTGYGYSAYAADLTTQLTIPRDAFRLPYGANDLLPGNYHLYIYAFSGSPDSALSSTLLPVPMPSQLPDNVDNNRLKGNFGTIVVTKRVPLQVISG